MIDYHSDYSATGSSMLKVFLDSRVEYKLRFVDRTLPSPIPSGEMDFGSIMHRVLLERNCLDDIVAVYADDCFKSDGALNPKPAAAFRDEQQPKICVKQEMWDRLRAALSACRGTIVEELCRDRRAIFEERVDGQILDVPCKCKPDIRIDETEIVRLYDLKFVSQIYPASFRRLGVRLRYWLQDAHYCRIIGDKTDKLIKFTFIAIENHPPYRVQPYWYDITAREMSRKRHFDLMIELWNCLRHHKWEERWDGRLSLGAWELGDPEPEPELVGFDE
jgi:hypothetical protein